MVPMNPEATEKTEDQQKPWLYKPGQSGNPKGRPKGVKNQFKEKFTVDCYEHWQKNGAQALDMALTESAVGYCKMMAGQLPKEVNVKMDPYEEMTNEQLLARAIQISRAIGLDRVIQDSGDAGAPRKAKSSG